jgi:small GTP-binding protein
MIQKKICMVGMFSTGKTSLVRRFVDSIFSERYHSTVGVKIDRRRIRVDQREVNLLLWDMEGRSETGDLRLSYLRGAAGVLFVADGTRPDTYQTLFEMRRTVSGELGEVPSLVALNKYDLIQDWCLTEADYQRLAAEGIHYFLTSAKTGEGVEQAFQWLATETVRSHGARI